jgi:hypothetical protein
MSVKKAFQCCQEIPEKMETIFPEDISSVENVTEFLATHCRDMIIWAHPNTQFNVVCPSSICSIMATVATAIYNPNIIEDEASARFADAEIECIAMLYNPLGFHARTLRSLQDSLKRIRNIDMADKRRA